MTSPRENENESAITSRSDAGGGRAELLADENGKLRKILQRVLRNLTYDPQCRTYYVSEIAWFAQPYMAKGLGDWLRAELAAVSDQGVREAPAEPDLHAIAKDASERASKNARVVPQLLYAPILFALWDAFPALKAKAYDKLTSPIVEAPAEPQACGWQLLSTAPKDGTVVLLSSFHSLAQNQHLVSVGQWLGLAGWVMRGGKMIKPTHWMSLPAPPVLALAPTPEEP